MQLFSCQHCGQLIYFENTRCERCGYALAYLPRTGALSALEPLGDGSWRPLAAPERVGRLCANAQHDACNWLVPTEEAASSPYCVACQHNRTVPDLSVPENVAAWRQMELAKRRLFYTLLKLRLPMPTKAEDPASGLAFDFMADSAQPDGPKVMTGHDEGLITINLIEADDAERERRRRQMGEPYRTLLGHFRHEVGHYYWDRLVRDGSRIDACRALFGDDREDYGEALKAHYRTGPPADWRERFISAYATTHAWEDWAETWAHYLHIVDTLETAQAFRMRVDPPAAGDHVLAAVVDFDVYDAPAFSTLVETWLPLVFAVNYLNRSMGQPDLYPFVLTAPVIGKLGFIHELVRGSRGG